MSGAAAIDLKAAGERMHAFASELQPLPRSITGPGLRATLDAIGRRIDLERRFLPTGAEVFDWTVPREWSVREAWLRAPDGSIVADFARSPLELVNYSVPFRGRVSRAELEPHLHSLPDRPDWVPYRTSYYREDWGFCLPHRRREALPPGDYEVHIDATLAPGKLDWGELLLPGEHEEEWLLSAHVCHPALANDNLSAVVVFTELALELTRRPRRWSWRFLFAPGTIGAIAWLHTNRDRLGRIRGGLVGACLGDPGPFHYKRSRRGDALVDRAALHVLAHAGTAYQTLDFVPFGYDERQFNSPGIALDVGSLTRTPHGRYPEYHTSADDLDFITPDALAGSLERLLEIVEVLEGERRYRSLNPMCEPQLGRRGLYRALGGGEEGRERELAYLWVLNLADGRHSLLDTAERAKLPFRRVAGAARDLLDCGLLEPLDDPVSWAAPSVRP